MPPAIQQLATVTVQGFCRQQLHARSGAASSMEAAAATRLLDAGMIVGLRIARRRAELTAIEREARQLARFAAASFATSAAPIEVTEAFVAA